MGSLAIVGCGAAGTALVVQLAHCEWEGIDRILIIDPRIPASGIAFDRDEEYLLCNTSVGVNSVIPHDPGHFLEWLRRNPTHTARWGVASDEISEHSYLPRGLFLAYLAAYFDRAVTQAQSHGVFDHVPASAHTIESSASGITIVTDSGETFPVGEAVICTGLHPSEHTLRRQAVFQSSAVGRVRHASTRGRTRASPTGSRAGDASECHRRRANGA